MKFQQFLAMIGLGITVGLTIAAIHKVGWLAGLICGVLLLWFLFFSLPTIFLGKGYHGCGGVLIAGAVLIFVPLALYIIEVDVVDNGRGASVMDPVTFELIPSTAPGGKTSGPGGDYVADKV